MTGDDNPQAQMGGGGFGHGGFGINMEDIMAGFGGFGGGGFGGHHGGQRGGRQQRRGGATYTFTFGGGDGMRFEF